MGYKQAVKGGENKRQVAVVAVVAALRSPL